MYGAYNNHHQIFTHSVRHGIIIGQLWQEKNGRAWGTIRCITDRGWIILDHAPKMIANRRVYYTTLIREWKLAEGVELHPFLQKDGKVHVQAIRNVNGWRHVWGELRNNFDDWMKEITSYRLEYWRRYYDYKEKTNEENERGET